MQEEIISDLMRVGSLIGEALAIGSGDEVVGVSPQWADTPTAVMERAAAIRNAPPEYLAGFEEQELGDYDIVLNEIFSRPSSKTTYIAALQEVQCLCEDQVDDVCDLLSIPMTWHELKGAIVARVM